MFVSERRLMDMNETLVRTAEARDFLRVSRAMFCRLQKKADFPRPVRFGARCLRWRLSELLAFAENVERVGRVGGRPVGTEAAGQRVELAVLGLQRVVAPVEA